MKNFTTVMMAGLITVLLPLAGFSQPDTAKISARVIFFADSLIKADTYKNWNVYANLAPEGVIKHYGGKDGYIEQVKKLRVRVESSIEEAAPELKVQQLLTQNEEWQSVIRVSRYIHREDKQYHVVTFFVCQSKDDGQTWRMFDVAYNKVANLIYMMPDIFGDLTVREATVMTQEEELAKEQQDKAIYANQKAKKK